MIKYDFHIHTELCGHAPGQTVEKILAAADSLKLETIAITEHIFQPDDRNRILEINNEIRKHHHKCKVLTGAEIDVDRNSTCGEFVMNDRSGLDYVLGALHYLPGTNILPHCNKERPFGAEEIIKRWKSAVLGAVSRPFIDTLAHPGIFIACSLGDDYLLTEVVEVLQEAADLSVKNNIAWELNNQSCRKLSPSQFAEYHKVIQIGIDSGVRFTYGSDAHRPEEIGRTDFLERLPGIQKLLSETGEK